MAAFAARTGAYALAYGNGILSPEDYLLRLALFTLPCLPAGPPSQSVVYPSVDLLFTGVAGAAWYSVLRRASRPLNVARVLAFGVLPPVLGAALYLPWPLPLPQYGLGFLFGPALLLGLGASWAERRAPWRAPARLLYLVLTGITAVYTQRYTGMRDARFAINDSLARMLPAFAGKEPIYLGVTDQLLGSTMPWGTRLRAYAAGVTGREVPFIHTVDCGAFASLLRSASQAVAIDHTCRETSNPAVRLRAVSFFLDPSSARIGRDSVVVAITYLPP
jgi:hypothetical protein